MRPKRGSRWPCYEIRYNPDPAHLLWYLEAHELMPQVRVRFCMGGSNTGSASTIPSAVILAVIENWHNMACALIDHRYLLLQTRYWGCGVAALADGHIHVVLEPVAFLRRWIGIIPPPRRHLVRYAGVCGQCSTTSWLFRQRRLPRRDTGQEAPPAHQVAISATSAEARGGPGCSR